MSAALGTLMRALFSRRRWERAARGLGRTCTTCAWSSRRRATPGAERTSRPSSSRRRAGTGAGVEDGGPKTSRPRGVLAAFRKDTLRDAQRSDVGILRLHCTLSARGVLLLNLRNPQCATKSQSGTTWDTRGEPSSARGGSDGRAGRGRSADLHRERVGVLRRAGLPLGCGLQPLGLPAPLRRRCRADGCGD